MGLVMKGVAIGLVVWGCPGGVIVDGVIRGDNADRMGELVCGGWGGWKAEVQRSEWNCCVESGMVGVHYVEWLYQSPCAIPTSLSQIAGSGTRRVNECFDKVSFSEQRR